MLSEDFVESPPGKWHERRDGVVCFGSFLFRLLFLHILFFVISFVPRLILRANSLAERYRRCVSWAVVWSNCIVNRNFFFSIFQLLRKYNFWFFVSLYLFRFWSLCPSSYRSRHWLQNSLEAYYPPDPPEQCLVSAIGGLRTLRCMSSFQEMWNLYTTELAVTTSTMRRIFLTELPPSTSMFLTRPDRLSWTRSFSFSIR